MLRMSRRNYWWEFKREVVKLVERSIRLAECAPAGGMRVHPRERVLWHTMLQKLGRVLVAHACYVELKAKYFIPNL